jgi:type IV pilus assembly protein PilC
MSNNSIIILSEKFETPKNLQQKSWWDTINDALIANQKVKLKDKVTFYRLLATMVNAGLTVLQSIKVLHEEQKNPVMKKIQDSMIKDIQSGHSLSATLRLFPKSFSDSEVAMIESGEKTGKLNIALLQLATQIEKLSSLSKKLIGALIYPALIIVVMIGVIFVLMWQVVPKLIGIFTDFGGLPPATQMLVNASDFVQNYWYLFFIIPFLFTSSLTAWRKTEHGLYITDKALLKTPGVGQLLEKIIISRFSRLLASLMSSGVSIVEALRIISGALGNEVYRQRVLLLRDDVTRGVTMGTSLENDPLFPDMVTQMIKVGEETAKIDSIIIKVADFYDEEVDGAVSAINKIIEPVIIVTMAVVVGFIAYAIMSPIMQLSDVISQQ